MSQKRCYSSMKYSSEVDSVNNEYNIDRLFWKSSNNINPLVIEHYISGISFPVTREELILRAELNNAPPSVLNALNRFLQPLYHCYIDISKELSRNSR